MRSRSAALLLAVCLLALPSPGRADYDDALRAFEGGRDAVARRELAPLVRSGSPSALFLLGVMRETGRGTAKDPAGAARLYRRAADGGNVSAMVALGLLYYRGEGVGQSDARASAYFRKAADKGSARALYLLGLMRLSGRGGPTADAVGYLRRAVRAGSPEAAAVLGELLLAGRGVVANPAAAYAMALHALAGDRIEAATRQRLNALAANAKKALDPTVALRIEGKAPEERGAARGGGKGRGAAPKGQVITGTGFVVSRLGHVLTNAHVAAHCRRLMAVVDGRRMAASLLRADQDHDLALLRLAVAPPEALAFREGDALPPGVPVFAAGYPGRAALSGRMRVTAGKTRELAKGAGPRGEQAVTAEVLPGNSGGPLLDHAGHVAGVVAARRDTETTRRIAGDAPADMGFVVPLSVVKAFLARGQVPIVSAPSARRLDAAGIARTVSGKVVPLFCQTATSTHAP
ncbi:Sel1 domain protein repeat-containing protein [Solidesulfovibrio fructosivorans JJ]]|uniref:Sel1 domain protein repeat-containing protein n=1 Tax=Solidesulfovibrio fructosivorans JJ] TaxID=596151 RepID=E1JX38_SOLFR|nr:tetratricopeptide repeat-containing serine protease family protein [Solidesulfovibrio fructosivorans]EFL51003.1 Sel1 domain protein repeat-containing protein [Solidesulfovibrio fructosivorans JJ]]